MARHFQEWGTIERTRVLPARGVAFVTYTTEALAQFAKEAMAHQALDNGEILNVRWATMDPNPQAQKREARMIEEQAADAIRRALPESFVREIEGKDPDAKRRRKEEGAFGLEGYEASDDVWFKSEKEKMALHDAEARAALQPAEQRLMIEEAQQRSAQSQVQSGSSGILSSSTLAALNSYNTEPRPTSSKVQPGGPLVGYDDDDSD